MLKIEKAATAVPLAPPTLPAAGNAASKAPQPAANTNRSAAAEALNGRSGFDTDMLGLKSGTGATAAKRTEAASGSGGVQGGKAAVDAVEKAAEDYEDAKEKKDELDKRLTEELAHVGPGLTDEQRQKFVDGFHDKHKDVYAKEKHAAQHLAQVLEHNLGKLERLAETCSSAKGASSADAAQVTARALRDLAGSSAAVAAVRVTGELLGDKKDGRTLLAVGGAELREALGKVAEDALPRAAGDVMAREDSPGEAMKEIEKLISPFVKGKQLYGAGKKIDAGLDALRDASRGDFSKLKALAHGWKHDPPGRLEKGLAAIGVMLGAGNFAQDKDFKSAVKAMAKVKSGVEVLAKSVRGLSVGGEVAAKLGKVAKIAGRFAPGVGAVINLANAAVDFREALKGGHPGSYVKAVGDLLSAGGAAAEALGPVGVVVGGIINGVGTALSFIGDGINALFGSHPESPEDEAQKILEDRLHLGEKVAKGLAHSDPKAMRMADAMGLTPKQVKGLAAEYPKLLDSAYMFDRFNDIRQAMNIPPGKFDEMLDRVARWVADKLDTHAGNGKNEGLVDRFYSATQLMLRDLSVPEIRAKLRSHDELATLARSLSALAG